MFIVTAIQTNDIEYVEHYIENNGDVDNIGSKGDYHRTLLMHAARSDHIEIGKLLIKAGCDINAKDIDNKGEPDLSALNYCKSYKFAKLLINNGADINSVNGEGFTIVMSFCRKHASRFGSLNQRKFNIIKLLIESGCEYNLVKIEGVLRNIDYFIKNSDRLLKELKQSIQSIHLRNKLLHICARYIKNNMILFKNRLSLLNRDERKLLN